jgi:sRNA-binding carbon storage regulator CsrA
MVVSQGRCSVLILTCRVGETIRIGNDLSVTLQDRCRGRVTVSVIGPVEADLYFDNVCMRPSVLPSGARSYLFSMLAIRRFRVGEVEIRVWLPGDAVSLAAECDEHLHIGVIAPKSLQVSCESKSQDVRQAADSAHALSGLVWA